MNRIFLFIFSFAVFYACSKDDNSTGRYLEKATVKGATAIYQSGGSAGRATTEEVRRYMTIDDKGTVRPIRFITESGDTVDMNIECVRDLDSRYLLMQGGFRFNKDVYFKFLFVNKETEALYALNFRDVGYMVSDKPAYSDDNGNIYTEFDGELYKFNVSDPNNITMEQYLPSEQYKYGNNNGVDIAVSKNGLLLFGDYDFSKKIKCPGSRIYKMDDFFRQELGEGNENRYLDFRIFPVEKTFYAVVSFSNSSGVGGSEYQKYLVELNLIGNNELTLAVLQEAYFGKDETINFIDRLDYNPVRKTYEGGIGDPAERKDFIWDYDPKTNTLTKTAYVRPVNSPDGSSAQSIWYRSYEKEGCYESYRLADYSKGCEVDLKAHGVDEVYDVVFNPSREGFTFTGFRYSDSKNVIGKVEENGDVTINEDTKSSSKITTLLLLN